MSFVWCVAMAKRNPEHGTQYAGCYWEKTISKRKTVVCEAYSLFTAGVVAVSGALTVAKATPKGRRIVNTASSQRANIHSRVRC